MIRYVIPARKGSKGFPLKNRKLFKATADTVADVCQSVIVTTDDKKIKKMARKDYRFVVHDEPAKLATDGSSVRGALLDTIRKNHIKDNDIIVMLYLTYPQRTRKDIEKGVENFLYSGARSMLCKIEPLTHPYLCMIEDGDRGRQVVDHDLCRRQEYPVVFEISHLLFIAYADEIEKLNRNLYNESTIFWPHHRLTDVDLKEDYDVYTDGKE